jgi:hypothetical protein
MRARDSWVASSGPRVCHPSLIPRVLTRMGNNKERLEEVSGDTGVGSQSPCQSLAAATALARWHLGRFTEPRGSYTTQQWARQIISHPR